WRPWLGAILQTGVNLGVVGAIASGYLLRSYPYRTVFLVGVLPALIVLWIRKAVPETDEWHRAKAESSTHHPRIRDLFRGSIRRITILTILVCSFSLTAHWAFTFWYLQQLRVLPEIHNSPEWPKERIDSLVTYAFVILMAGAISGNFFAALLAKLFRYRYSIAVLSAAYFVLLYFVYGEPRDHSELLWWFFPLGMCQGIFG